MKKASLLLAALLLPFAAAEATVTLNFSGGAGAALRTASNFQDHLGGNTAKVWGIIVDTTGNGFANGTTAVYDGGFNYTATNAGGALGQNLSIWNGTTSTLSDDRLFISQNLAAAGTGTQDGAVAGTSFLTQIAAMDYGTGVGALTAGMKFALVWFEVSALGGTSVDGQYYGLYAHESLALQADPCLYNLQDSTAFVQGLDPLRTANRQLGIIPEPSALLLGGLGLVGLLRRRR